MIPPGEARALDRIGWAEQLPLPPPMPPPVRALRRRVIARSAATK